MPAEIRDLLTNVQLVAPSHKTRGAVANAVEAGLWNGAQSCLDRARGIFR